MKVLVVLALSLVLVAGIELKYAPEFALGKTYTYKYEAVILGGLPEAGLAKAGVKLSSKVIISAEAPNTFLLKLLDPELYEYSGIWPTDPFVPATKLTSALAAQLLTPIKFQYANGVVGAIFAPAGVSTTVLNVFRGVLNLLQLNIKKTQNVYELQEAGTQGACRTHYVISEDVKTERLHLTKTKDLNHCQELIHKDIGLAYTEKCVQCQARGMALKGAVAINYILKPAATGALLLEATATELIQFSPFNILNGAAQMEAKQLLTYVGISKTPVLPIAAAYISRGSLQYEFATELLQTPIQLLRITNAEAQIVEVLNHLVTYNVAKVHEDAPLKFVELIQLLRVVSYERVDALWSQYKVKPAYRHWFLNAVPAIGTHASLKFIKEKFLLDDISVVEAAQALIGSIHMVTADLESIKLIEAMISHHKIQANAVLREVAMLGFGTMVNKYCAATPLCPVDLVKPIHDLLIQSVANADIDGAIIAVKVLGNAGHPASLKPIMKLLPGFSTAAAALPLNVHIEAILALRNIAKKEPKLIQDLAVQVFMDKALKAEIRMAAALVLFETRLPMGLVTAIADATLKESNLQVASFVYSYMKSMTKNTAPDYASVATACAVAVKMLSPKFDRLSLRFSRALYLDAYHNPMMVGAAASAFYINDAATVMPKAVVAKARTYFAGAYADVLELGVRTEGIQEALLKLPQAPVDADRITKIKHFIRAISNWRATAVNQPLASVYVKFFGQEIGFASIDKAIIDQLIQVATGPSVATYGRKALEALLSGISFHYAKPMLVAEVRRIMPSNTGLPIELSFYTAAVAAATVEFATTVSPPLPLNFAAAQLLKSDIEIRTAVTPSVSMHTYAVMGVNTALIQAAIMSIAKIHTIVPAKIEARIDLIKGNFKIQALPVQGLNKITAATVETFAIARNVEDLAAAKLTPMIPVKSNTLSRETFTSKIASRLASLTSSLGSGLSKSSEIIPVDLPENLIRKINLNAAFAKKMCGELKTFGIKACAEIESRNAAAIKDCPLYAVIGKHALILEISPAAGPVIEKIEVEIQVGEKAVEKVIKVINRSQEEETIEEKNVLLKLKKILVPGLRNATRSSSSSSSSSSLKSSSSSSSSSRSSSSSSSSSARVSKQQSFEMRFSKTHIHQHSVSAARTSSRSSAASFEAIYNKAKYLANAINPTVTILVRAVRADHKAQGYQATAYWDKPASRVQLILANLVEENHWRICADAVLLSYEKIMAKVAWGIDCKEFETKIIAETGLVGKSSAMRLKFTWDKLPTSAKRYAKMLSDYLGNSAQLAGVEMSKAKNSLKQLKLTLALTSDKTLNIVLKTPKRTFYKLAVLLPVYIPVGNTADELVAYQNSLSDKIIYVLTKANAAECTIVNDKVTTFNQRIFKNQMPESCSQVLAQDCTEDLKFIVLLKKDLPSNKKQINVNIADIEVDLIPLNNDIIVKINGVILPAANLPYQHPTNKIQIKKLGEGIALHAPSHGLQEVFLDANTLKVKVADWMKGQTCGLCGKADGEVREEYQTPNGRLASNSVSYAQSWVIPAESCRDLSKCYMKLESVKLEKQMILHGEESKCFSVEPVLRCLSGCTPLKTIPVTIGFHCLSADSNMSSTHLNNIYEKSEDLKETTEAHLACRCSAQCA
uniref:Vitellogenin B n=1 Tax=Melanogrammus aeglefinus TaxID=8056 RepID=Q98T87_MELAE|nr:vitellogenin B [Melanogrammus aeglefinus]